MKKAATTLTAVLLALPAGAATLSLDAMKCNKQSGFIVFHGQVTNTGSAPISNLAAVGITLDANDKFISSDDALIDYDPLLPGQSSPFSIYVRFNPAIKACRVEFRNLLSRSRIEHFVLEDTIRTAQKLLKGWGYYTGSLDGQAGPMTKAALARFAAANAVDVPPIDQDLPGFLLSNKK